MDGRPMTQEAVIVVSAVVVRNGAGDILTVRKRGTTRFMFPGGKPEPGESPAQTAVREVVEEVGIVVDADRLHFLGIFTAPAANEALTAVRATAFICPDIVGDVTPSGEIDAVRWQSIDESRCTSNDLAPLLRDAVFPALRTQWPPETAASAGATEITRVIRREH